MTLAEHAASLAKQLGVDLWVCMTCATREDDVAGEANKGDSGHSLAFITRTLDDDPMAYLTALHELGHHAHAKWDRRPRQLEEYLAWAWALKHAEVELTPCVWGEIAWRIRSYTNDRRYKPIPELHSLLAEAERNADVRD